MTTVPQPYDYLISSIPGGAFDGNSSTHLLYLIETQLPAAVGPVINSDGLSVVITFDSDLTTEQKTTLDTLVEHSADFYLITKDGGITDLGDPAVVATTAGLSSSSVITLRYKMGDGTNFNGFGEEVNLHAPIMTIDKIDGNIGVTGLFQFTIGSELNRGEVEIQIEVQSLPTKTLIARWS